MLQMWNKNMGTNFLPSWINCIDEMMSKYPCNEEPGYIMMLMSTYGMTLTMRVTKRWHYTVEGVRKVVEFQYPEIVHNHYKFHDMIDNHNSF